MRVRDHVAVSTLASALASPWGGREAVGLWAGSVLIDADHYVWYCLRHRSLNPRRAARFFNGARPERRPATRALHSPAVLMAALALAARRRELLPVVLGMSMHVLLDVRHEARMDEARAAALDRDAFVCQSCGVRGPDVETHLWRQPWLMPSYATENLVSLCARCHEIEHAPGKEWRASN
ncbi:MAG TPA: hypothetical protein VE570_08100 [Thermoleophilaceae bacterium]|jgi:hypothetical protein|nr:hypothetical protein [Thermoleophilaceae bacterium]